MKTLVILGAGTGGTIIANRMAHLLDTALWKIVVVDRDPVHYYQPGFLYIPFNLCTPADVTRPKQNLLPSYIEVFFSDIDRIDPSSNRIFLTQDRRVLHYDALVIATGCEVVPYDGENVFDFYTLSSAKHLSRILNFWRGGRLVVDLKDVQTKYPIAALEFMFLADWFFSERQMRDKVELVYATSASTPFNRPLNTPLFWHLCKEKGIEIITRADAADVGYDLLVTTPEHQGAAVIGGAGLGDAHNFVSVDPYTLQSTQYDNIWAIGDAASLPRTIKSGSAAHFMADVVIENILYSIKGKSLSATYDGHTNCVVDTGYEKAVLLDYNNEIEPLPGKYPFAGVGPFPLLEESTTTYRGKQALRWLYWNGILQGMPLPITSVLSMSGKQPC